MNLKRIALLASAAGALALGGCGGRDEPKAPNNAEDMTPIETENSTVETTVPTEAPAAPRIDNVTSEAPPEAAPPSLSADEQTQDDADATGMTARVSRDEGGNEGQPAN
ncbi:hypothetical protein E5A73_00615 [Sphingomonas gei]|uniref:Argininosuccinate lyase n=1 Tax=Sphingomonas gei TaxID=1395960 RepID=A0A4S1XHZ7_9SPHN|nr:hypothetical protein [Sphingomonas gei]TGX55675.1 hypothetical protein E5A73_00615 [Sphingomonas gei]